MKDLPTNNSEIIDKLPKWVFKIKDVYLEIIKKQAPEEYEKLRKRGLI